MPSYGGAISFGSRALFSLGQVVATPGAIELLEQQNVTPIVLLEKHSTGNWGSLCEEDKHANEVALKTDQRILSSYDVGMAGKVWIITEWDRSVTTILLPSEY